MFRHVQLPDRVRGSLLLHSMPGRLEPLEVAWRQVRADGVEAIVNLARPDEIWEKSPDYAKALQSGHLPCPVISFPIQDYGTPRSRAQAQAKLDQIVEQARSTQHAAHLVERLYEIKTGEPMRTVALRDLPR